MTTLSLGNSLQLSEIFKAFLAERTDSINHAGHDQGETVEGVTEMLNDLYNVIVHTPEPKPRCIHEVLKTAEVANYELVGGGGSACSVRVCTAGETDVYGVYVDLNDLQVCFTAAEIDAAKPCQNGSKSWYINSEEDVYCVDFMTLVTL